MYGVKQGQNALHDEKNNKGTLLCRLGSVLYMPHTIFKVMELNYSKARIFSAAPRRLLIMKRRPCKA